MYTIRNINLKKKTEKKMILVKFSSYLFIFLFYFSLFSLLTLSNLNLILFEIYDL